MNWAYFKIQHPADRLNHNSPQTANNNVSCVHPGGHEDGNEDYIQVHLVTVTVLDIIATPVMFYCVVNVLASPMAVIKLPKGCAISKGHSKLSRCGNMMKNVIIIC